MSWPRALGAAALADVRTTPLAGGIVALYEGRIHCHNEGRSPKDTRSINGERAAK